MKLKSGFKQKIALGVVFVLIFAYTVFHIVNIFGEDISTFAAGVTTESKVLSNMGYVFRDETVLTSEKSGIVDYLVADGTKVSEGQQVAVAYSKGSLHQDYVSRINECISVLEQSTSGTLGNVDIVEQRKKNSDLYDSIIKSLTDGETGGLGYQTEQLLIGMNTVNTILEAENFDCEKALEALYEERDRVFSESGSSVACHVEKSGYFFSGSDGNEELFTSKAAENLTADSFDKLIEKSQQNEAEKGAYGKICYSSQWSLVMALGISDEKYFEEGETYTALFSENNRTELPMKLEKLIEDKSEERILLVFSCDRQPNNFTFDRCQSVSITVKTVSGIYVPKSVVVREGGVRGVYILRGSVVHFRYIEILHEGSDYYLVKRDSEHDEKYTFLRENDMIILNGRNLFDGRVLD